MKTVKQLAAMGNVTPQTIRNEAKRQNIVFQKNGREFCCADDDGFSILTAIDVRKNVERKTKEAVKFAQNDDLLLTLLEQLKAKDSQIANMQEQLTKLTDTVAELSNAVRAAQALHAGTIQERITSEAAAEAVNEAASENADEEQPKRSIDDANEAPAAPEEKKRETWWSRLWK